jgi:hypothetical protein
MRNGADGETRTLVGQCPAVYKTAAVAAEPHRQNGGSPRNRTEFSPVKSRDFTVKVCNPGGHPQDRDAKVELNHRSQVCEALTGTGVRVAKMVGHEGSAPCIPVWKTGVYLSTPMPDEMESRAGIAPASAVLQTAA